MSNWIFFLLCLAGWPVVRGILFIIKPNPVYEGDSVTLRCAMEDEHSPVYITYSLTIKRKLHNSPTFTTIAYIIEGNNDDKPFLKDKHLKPIILLDGKFDPSSLTNSFLEVILSPMTSLDIGHYMCEISYVGHDFSNSIDRVITKIIILNAVFPQSIIRVINGEVKLTLDSYPAYERTPLQIRCEPGDSEEVVDAKTLAIRRQFPYDYEPSTIASAATEKEMGEAIIVDTDLKQTATVSGMCDGRNVKNSYIGLILPVMTSNDSAEYICSIEYENPDEDILKSEVSRTITVQRFIRRERKTQAVSESLHLTVSPVTIFESNPVTVRCDIVNVTLVDKLRGLVLKRTFKYELVKTIAYAWSNKSNGRVVVLDESSGTVTGKCDNYDVAGSFIQIDLTASSVHKSTQYRCYCHYVAPTDTYLTSVVYLDVVVRDPDQKFSEPQVVTEKAQLSIRPNPIYDGVPKTVRCSVGKHTYVESIEMIGLQRKLIEETEAVLIASASTNENNGKTILEDPSLSSTAVVTGKCDNNDKAGSYVEIHMWTRNMTGIEKYICFINYSDISGELVQYETSAYITVLKVEKPVSKIEKAEVVMVKVNPYAIYEGQSLRIKCSIIGASKVIKLQSISLNRKLSGESSYTEVASALPVKYSGKAYLSETETAGVKIVSGQCNNSDIAGSYVQVIFDSSSKSDTGTYECSVFYYAQAGNAEHSYTRILVNVADPYLQPYSGFDSNSTIPYSMTTIAAIVLAAFIVYTLRNRRRQTKRNSSTNKSDGETTRQM